MSYKREFGTKFDLGFKLKDYPFLKDRSWHNDLSPSFYFKINSNYFVLWVDHADKSKREGDNSRYLIQIATNEGNETQPEIYGNDGDVIFYSENAVDLDEFLAFSFDNI